MFPADLRGIPGRTFGEHFRGFKSARICGNVFKFSRLLSQRKVENHKSISSFNQAFIVFLASVSCLLLFMLVSIIRDILYRKEAEEKLRKYSILESKSKEMEQFAYIASHDLREPLLTIKNYAEILIEDCNKYLTENGRHYTESISKSANRMETPINGLLDYSMLSKVKQIQNVDCNEIMKEVQADLDLLITSTNTNIIFKTLPILKAYPLELKLLFQNLIDNAIKFRRKDVIPEINITAQKIKDGWQFEVKDNGIGIEKNDQKKISIIFQRLHNRNEYPGTGKGLAHCKKITELHSGNIWIESKPGDFSSFYFTILTESL